MIDKIMQTNERLIESLKNSNAEITRLRAALTAREQATVGGVPDSDSIALSLCMSECKRLQDSVAIREADALERVAQLLAHRACCSEEHDPVHGKIHGYCVVCGIPWPCSIAKSKVDTARDEAILNAHGKALPPNWVYTDSQTTLDLLVAEITTLRFERDKRDEAIRMAEEALSGLVCLECSLRIGRGTQQHGCKYCAKARATLSALAAVKVRG